MNQNELIEQMMVEGASTEQIIEALEMMEERNLPVPEEEPVSSGYIERNGRKYLARREIGYLAPVPEKDKQEALSIGKTMIDSEVAAMGAMMNMHQKDPNWKAMDCPSLVELLKQQNARIAADDMTPAESMLMNHAAVLEQAFTTLMARAFNNSGQTLENYLRLALRCQNQARASLETLSKVKNPVVIAKQLNVASGHQQVNNHAPARRKKRAERSIEHDLE